MAVRLAEINRKRIIEPIRKPVIQKPVVQKSNVPATTTKLGEKKFQADQIKFNLTNKLPADAPINPVAPKPLAPYEAVDKIKKLPTPPLNDQAATRVYQQQRADIADSALKTATPPTRDQFKGLPPKVASMEYQDSLNYYNNSVSELKNISNVANADLKAQPIAILDDSAKRVWDAGKTNPQAGAAALAKEVDNLNAKYGPEAGGQLVGKLYQDSKGGDYDHDLSNILTFAGGKETNGFGKAGLPEAQRNSIGTAIGQAYDKMSSADRSEFIKTAVATTEANGFRGNALGSDTTRIADLISRSDSPTLKNDAVNALTKRMTEIESKAFGNNGGADIKALANSAAIIAGSGATGAEQAKMFDTIIKSFPDMKKGQLASLMEDSTLKDNLSKIFINNSEAITNSLTNRAGDLSDPKATDGLRQFFEMTMFSKDGGALRQDVMGEAVKLISKFGDPSAIPTAGRTKVDDARTAGSLVGLIQAAALNQRDAIKGDQKAREETTKMFVGTAFAFVPGASKVLGEGSGKLLQVGYDKAVDYAKSNAESGLGKLINELSDGESLKNIDKGFKSVRDLHYQVRNGLDGEQDSPIYQAFETSYASTGVDQLFAKAFGG